MRQQYDLGKKGKGLVDNILEKQKNITLGNGSSTLEEVEEIKRKLSELLKEEIQAIPNKQAEETS